MSTGIGQSAAASHCDNADCEHSAGDHKNLWGRNTGGGPYRCTILGCECHDFIERPAW